MPPTLSVVLPVHDVERYLPDTLGSLARNDRADFEYIVVDDASTDSTPEIVERFAARLPGLRVIRTETSVGVGDARNLALDVAQGRFVMFLDGDDWIAPGYLADLVEAIDTLGCDFVRVDHVRATGTERVLERAPGGRRNQVLRPREHVLPAEHRTIIDYPYPWAGVYRRDLGELLRFPTGLRTAADRAWIWQHHLHASSFAVVSLAGLFYRRDVATSLTTAGSERLLHFIDAYRLVFEALRDDAGPGPDLTPKAVAQFVNVFAFHLKNIERMPPDVAQQLRERGRDLLAELPTDLLLATPMNKDRAGLIGPNLPTGLTVEQLRIVS